MGERGVGLSGGQRQRIAIARALLIDPRLLILDDSTSAVDAGTEAALLETLDRLMRDGRRTALVIAQRLSTVRDADLILVLDGGRIVERGTRDAPGGQRRLCCPLSAPVQGSRRGCRVMLRRVRWRSCSRDSRPATASRIGGCLCW